jgi:hypothetical protein
MDLVNLLEPVKESVFYNSGTARDQLYPRIQELTNNALTLSLNHLMKGNKLT